MEMEQFISKAPWQSRNISLNRNIFAMSSPYINADAYRSKPLHWSDISQPTYDQMKLHQYMKWNQARNGNKVQYHGQKTPLPPLSQRAVYRRQVEDDIAKGRYGFYNGVEVSGPYRDSYHNQVPKESSPQTTQNLEPVKDQNYYRTKFAPQHSNSSPLDDGIEINPTFTPQTTQKLEPVKDQNYYSTKFAPRYSTWSPLDDGIEINPTFTVSREDFNECVDFTLYGLTKMKKIASVY